MKEACVSAKTPVEVWIQTSGDVSRDTKCQAAKMTKDTHNAYVILE